MIRIIGFLLIVAAAALLYLSPQSSIPLRWRGDPVPSTWPRIVIAGGVTIAVPPDMPRTNDEASTTHYTNDDLSLEIHTGDTAFAIQRDGATMDDFRANTLPIAGHTARIASWKRINTTTRPYQLGLSFDDKPLTLIFSADTEGALHDAKTVVHSIEFVE